MPDASPGDLSGRPVQNSPDGRGPATEDVETESDLNESLRALSRLSSEQFGLTELLTRVAEMAGHAIPGADGVGLTLLRADDPARPELVVTDADFVRRLDEVQYDLGEGPCVTAAREAVSVRSGSLSNDSRWPRFGARIRRMNVRSVLSVPLLTGNGVVGALNVYAYVDDAFDERAEQVGDLFAAPAAISVQNAQILNHAQRLVTQLQSALTSRPLIDQAIGVLRSRSGDTAQQAFEKLRDISQTEHRKLHDVAAAVVEEAAARARSRRHPLI
jgi:GAF domain-containing protein